MNRLKLGSELEFYGTLYTVKSISRKGVLFGLCENKAEVASELLLTLREVEAIVFNTQE
jgi:hypothetical protein